VAEITGSRIYKPILGKPVVIGGADLVFECVGSDGSINDALHLVKAGGKLVLVGAAGVPRGVDWTPIWVHELSVVGSYTVSTDDYEGRRMRTYEVGLELMAQGKLDLSPLLTHQYKLEQYKEAFRTLADRSTNRAFKAVFSFE
jgi:threonine dehydrogenase-like Zn-dependent dehydrogenase